MRENFNDKISAVLAGMNEDDAEYILRCIRAPKAEMKQMSESINRFYGELVPAKELLMKAENDFFERNEKICTLVKKYNDTLTADGIWNSVEASETKKKLNTFYSLLAAFEKLDGADVPQMEIGDLTENDMELGRKTSLLKRASFVFREEDRAEAEKIVSKYGLCHSMIAETARQNTLLFEKICHNESVLGKYVSSLTHALDEKNKGERMNLTLARNAAEVFFANYINEK